VVAEGAFTRLLTNRGTSRPAPSFSPFTFYSQKARNDHTLPAAAEAAGIEALIAGLKSCAAQKLALARVSACAT
jgi:hypothetical protein